MFNVGDFATVIDSNDSLFLDLVEITAFDPATGLYEVITTTSPKYHTYFKATELSRWDTMRFNGLSDIINMSADLPPLPKCVCTTIMLGCRCEFGKSELQKERSKNGTV